MTDEQDDLEIAATSNAIKQIGGDRTLRATLIGVWLLNLLPYTGLGLIYAAGVRCLPYMFFVWVLELAAPKFFNPGAMYLVFSILGTVIGLVRLVSSQTDTGDEAIQGYYGSSSASSSSSDSSSGSSFGSSSASSSASSFSQNSGSKPDFNTDAGEVQKLHISKDGTKVSFSESTDLHSALPTFESKLRRAETELSHVMAEQKPGAAAELDAKLAIVRAKVEQLAVAHNTDARTGELKTEPVALSHFVGHAPVSSSENPQQAPVSPNANAAQPASVSPSAAPQHAPVSPSTNSVQQNSVSPNAVPQHAPVSSAAGGALKARMDETNKSAVLPPTVAVASTPASASIAAAAPIPVAGSERARTDPSITFAQAAVSPGVAPAITTGAMRKPLAASNNVPSTAHSPSTANNSAAHEASFASTSAAHAASFANTAAANDASFANTSALHDASFANASAANSLPSSQSSAVPTAPETNKSASSNKIRFNVGANETADAEQSADAVISADMNSERSFMQNFGGQDLGVIPGLGELPPPAPNVADEFGLPSYTVPGLGAVGTLGNFDYNLGGTSTSSSATEPASIFETVQPSLVFPTTTGGDGTTQVPDPEKKLCPKCGADLHGQFSFCLTCLSPLN